MTARKESLTPQLLMKIEFSTCPFISTMWWNICTWNNRNDGSALQYHQYNIHQNYVIFYLEGLELRSVFICITWVTRMYYSWYLKLQQTNFWRNSILHIICWNQSRFRMSIIHIPTVKSDGSMNNEVRLLISPCETFTLFSVLRFLSFVKIWVFFKLKKIDNKNAF